MKLSDNVLKKRVFRQHILDLHLKDFMIGQTTPYLNKFKNINHCFFSKKGGHSSGIYESLNCGLGSEDNKNNVTKNKHQNQINNVKNEKIKKSLLELTKVFKEK